MWVSQTWLILLKPYWKKKNKKMIGNQSYYMVCLSFFHFGETWECYELAWSFKMRKYLPKVKEKSLNNFKRTELVVCTVSSRMPKKNIWWLTVIHPVFYVWVDIPLSDSGNFWTSNVKLSLIVPANPHLLRCPTKQRSMELVPCHVTNEIVMACTTINILLW